MNEVTKLTGIESADLESSMKILSKMGSKGESDVRRGDRVLILVRGWGSSGYILSYVSVKKRNCEKISFQGSRDL